MGNLTPIHSLLPGVCGRTNEGYDSVGNTQDLGFRAASLTKDTHCKGSQPFLFKWKGKLSEMLAVSQTHTTYRVPTNQ